MNQYIIYFCNSGIGEKLILDTSGEVAFSVDAYETDHKDGMNLVEGEKVYVLGKFSTFITTINFL